ncbi:hypothetical protein NLX86_09800 [Streptomyces sp. A3M-1-3]|uniref:hypothetical protein n=1 Tax=Streptomyces sp. A3M-1-3 TaxID=2962044 RepID=UPI0020B7CE5E|nr:hypothetical protein [Streptomyces sp. A3M-1-3]MCP3818398.1 hypothetical protein [Streptomyces sp. A3M-1-3]
MRLYFAPEETDEFEATCGLLIHRMGRWADESGDRLDGFGVEAALDYRQRGTRDGRLGLWEPRHVEGFLLDWLPRTVTVLPGDEPGDMPGTRALLLRYLDAMGLADPRGATLAENLSAIEAVTPRYGPAMADRTRWGLSKFWVTTAAEQGTDVHDPEALQGFVERARRGEVACDEKVLDQVMARRLAHGPAARERAEPQLPVALPTEDELRALAEQSAVLPWLRGISAWAGSEGRSVTATGTLRISDARALVAELGTGDSVEGVRSSAQLPRLGLAVEWAKKARIVRIVKGRMYAVAKARPLLKDPLALWRRAFETFTGLRDPLVAPRSGWHFPSMVCDTFEEVVPDILNTLYSLPYAMPWPRLRGSTHLGYGTGSAVLLEAADRDLRLVLEALEDLGAIEPYEGMADPAFVETPLSAAPELPPAGLPPELAELFGTVARLQDPDAEFRAGARALEAELTNGPVELIRLTALGHDSVRRRLLAEGRDAPLLGELIHAPAAGLLGVLADHYYPDSERTELATWITARPSPAVALERLTDAMRACPFRTRTEAMLNVLAEAHPDGDTVARGLRGDPLLAPTAISVLVRREILDADDLTEPESLLMVAESLLQLLETTGPDGALEMLSGQHVPARETLAAPLASGHPDRAGMADLKEVVDQSARRPAAQVGRIHRRSGRKGGEGRGGKRRR